MIARGKKSQITVFLILGVVMILVVITLILIRNFSVKKTIEKETLEAKETEFGVRPIKNFVRECLFLVSKKALDEPTNDRPRNIQLKEYVEKNIDSCLDFSVFEEQGFEISKKEPVIDVNINENDITFKMTHPIIISGVVSGGKTEISEFLISHKMVEQ